MRAIPKFDRPPRVHVPPFEHALREELWQRPEAKPSKVKHWRDEHGRRRVALRAALAIGTIISRNEDALRHVNVDCMLLRNVNDNRVHLCVRRVRVTQQRECCRR